MNPKSLAILAGTASAFLVGSVHAESNFQTGFGALTATAHLDFQIVIPKILYLRVGAGTNLATNATINALSFTVPAASVGNGTAIASTGGDLASGAAVTARVMDNSGTVTITTTTPNMIKDAAGDTISYGQIALAVSGLTTGTSFTPAAMSDGAVTTTTIAPTVNVVNQDATWTFSYKNQNVVAAGTYGGVNVNNSRVTYTASIL